jgi:type II intron maturase
VSLFSFSKVGNRSPVSDSFWRKYIAKGSFSAFCGESSSRRENNTKYQSEYRGIVQYYLLAHNVDWFNKLHWVAETSLLKTLAGKHRSTVSKMAKKYKATIETEHGSRKCLRVVVPRGENKKALVSHFGGIPLKRKQNAILVDGHPQFVMTNRSELLQRMLADKCELCGSPNAAKGPWRATPGG